MLNPAELVDEFKKSGEFDRIRRELLSQFQHSKDGFSTFKARIDDIARERLASEQKSSRHGLQETIHKELMQEVDRYPVVERAVTEIRMLSDPSFTENIHSSVQKILRHAKDRKSEQGHGLSSSSGISSCVN